jgi:multiple sugar transport system permease protein
MKFVFLNNYISLVLDPLFWNAVKLTFLFVLFSVGLNLVVGFFLALMLNRTIYGRQALLTLFILPIVVTPVVAGLVWKFMFSADIGIISYVLRPFGIGKIPWLSKPWSALLAIIIVEVWQWSPFCMFFFLAGIENLPFSTREAGVIDGANSFQIFWHIILPQLIPVTLVIILLRLMDAFKSFDTIFVMTQGGPGTSTETLNILDYYIGFRYFNLGSAAALGLVVLFLVIFTSRLMISLTHQ